MECVLQKRSDLKPAPFDNNFSRLTKGQKLLLDMIKTHIQENRPITKEDIQEVYGQAMGVKRLYDGWYDDGEWKHGYRDVDVSKDEGRKKWRCMQWFRANLGSCVVQGKLIVIPVIEM